MTTSDNKNSLREIVPVRYDGILAGIKQTTSFLGHRTPAPLYSYPRKNLPGGISS